MLKVQSTLFTALQIYYNNITLSKQPFEAKMKEKNLPPNLIFSALFKLPKSNDNYFLFLQYNV